MIDNQAQEPIDPSTLSEAELEAAMASMDDGQEEDPLEEVPQEEEEEAQEESEESPHLIRIGEEDFTPDQLNEALSKARDYTAKTQRLAEERKEVEQMRQVLDAWQQPDLRPTILAHLAKEAGMTVSPQGAAQSNGPSAINAPADDIDLDDLSYESQQVYLAAVARANALEAKLAQVLPTLAMLNEFVEQQKQSMQRDTVATQAANAIREEYGVANVTAEQVREAMQATGLTDGTAAYLKVHAKALLQAGVQKGVSQAKVAKPNAPGASGGRKFDPMAKDADGEYVYSPGKAMAMLQAGWVPTS